MPHHDSTVRDIEETPATVAVLGPGGVGGLLAALLARAGHRVICIASDPTAQVLRNNGIQVKSKQFGEFTVAVEADTRLREPVDLCLVTVKHTNLEAALDRLPAEHLTRALIIPLLNGVEHLDPLRAKYGRDHVVPAVIRVESSRTTTGFIEHGSPFTQVDLAGQPDRMAGPAGLLAEAGLEVRVLSGEQATLWNKLAFLAPFALLTTHYRSPIGPVRSERRSELKAVVEETTEVARTCGATTEVESILSSYDAFPETARSSMLRDAEAGRPTELDAIGGAVVRAAVAHRIAVPQTARLISELTQRDRIERFLRGHGAAEIPHPGGTLLSHLIRVTDLLTTWGASREIRYAALCHAMYGTDGFDRALLDLEHRTALVELIGEHAEALVYQYAGCDRSVVYPRLPDLPVLFRDRFTGREYLPPEADVRAFMEITVANELDVLAHNAELAAAHGPALFEFFDRCGELLSPRARAAVRTRLGARVG